MQYIRIETRIISHKLLKRYKTIHCYILLLMELNLYQLQSKNIRIDIYFEVKLFLSQILQKSIEK